MGRRDPLVYRAPKPLWRRMLPAVAVVTVTALIAGLYLVRSAGEARVGTAVTDTAGSGDRVQHTVYLDGWTMRALSGKALRFQPGMSGTDSLPQPLPLSFTPLDGEELDELVASNPEIVEEAYARLVSGDSALRCSTEGCRNASGELPTSLLADLTTVPGLGSMYRAWNISAGLYRATFDAPVGDPVLLSLENAGALSLFAAEQGQTVVGENGTEITLTVAPSAENGWGNRSWYVASAWGVLFLPDARWNDDPAVINERGTGDAEPFPVPAAEVADPALLARGQADASPRSLAAFTNSQLTYFSSPVTGCGVAALCVPGNADVRVSEVARQSAPVCNADGDHAVVVAATTDWRVTLTGQVHAFGAWNGKDSQNFPGAAGSSVLGYRGAPELVGGQLDLRVNLWLLVNGTGEVFAMAGSRAQVGIDDAVYTRSTATLEDLGSFFGGEWSPCPTDG